MHSNIIETQTKSFTKWVNKQLEKKKFKPIETITDYSDGESLLNLINVLFEDEILDLRKNNIFAENKGNILSDFQKRDNIDSAIKFIENQKINLINISADLIFAKNVKLCLGLTWSLIVLKINRVTNSDDNFRSVLFNWCKNSTKNYGLNISDFTTSWKDGKAFNAILHNYDPSFDYEKIANHEENQNDSDKKDSNIKNNENNNNFNDKVRLEHAFDLAEKKYNISKLLDPSDLTDIVIPDEKSIMTYLSEYYLKLEQCEFRNNITSGKEYFKNMDNQINFKREDYEKLYKETEKILQKDSHYILTMAKFFKSYNDIVEKLNKLNSLYGTLKTVYPIFLKKEFEADSPEKLNEHYKKNSQYITQAKIEIKDLNEKILQVLSEKIEIEINNEKEEKKINDQDINENIEKLQFIKDEELKNDTNFNDILSEKIEFLSKLKSYKKFLNYRLNTAEKLFKAYSYNDLISANEMKNCCTVLDIPFKVEKDLNFDDYIEYVKCEFGRKEFE